MIKTLQLRFGRHPGSAPERVQLTPITVFVGPNYSGKSKVLQEIQQFVTTGQPGPFDLILDQLEFAGLEPYEAETRVASLTVRPQRDEVPLPDHVFIGKRRYRQQVPRMRMVNALINPTNDQSAFCSWYLALNTMILDGKSRIDLVQAQAAGDLQLQAQNALQLLFRDDNRRAELRRIIHEAFNIYLVVDPTNLGHLRLRLSQVEPPSHMIERGIHEDAVRFHCDATPIELASDGLKAFTGIMMEVIAGNPLVLLLDEPEAFLHPALEAAENLLGSLATYGVFVVPGGELESWLKNLGATGHGPTWLVNMFERLGEDPEDPSYIRPAAGDVWDFVASFREWFGDPNRRGIPP